MKSKLNKPNYNRFEYAGTKRNKIPNKDNEEEGKDAVTMFVMVCDSLFDRIPVHVNVRIVFAVFIKWWIYWRCYRFEVVVEKRLAWSQEAVDDSGFNFGEFLQKFETM